MKELLIAISVVAITIAGVLVYRTKKEAPSTVTYRESINYALEQMRRIRMPDGTACIGSSARPLGSPPHPFFLLTQYLSATASPPDLDLMLKDKSPAVRIAAAQILLWENRWHTDKKAVDSLLNDPESVTILDSCIPRRRTVGEIVAELKMNPRLFDTERKEANPADAPSLSGRGASP